MKPPAAKAKRRPVKATARMKKPAKVPDALGQLVNFLKGQWLRHDVLHRALGNEADKQTALRFARFVDAIKEVQSWQR
jgi:hypothetical protein